MSVKDKFISTRVQPKKRIPYNANPSGNQPAASGLGVAQKDDTFNLKTYIEDVVEEKTFTDISVTTLDVTGVLSVDIISEETSASGVTIDGVLLKDGLVVRKTASVTTTGVTQTFNCGANNVIFITTTTGSDLAKLSNSVINTGHQITLVHAVDGGELVLSKLYAADGIGITTVTFTDAGDTAT